MSNDRIISSYSFGKPNITPHLEVPIIYDTEVLAKFNKYVENHPEIVDIINGMYIEVMRVKPENIAEFFTNDFFNEDNVNKIIAQTSRR